MPGITDEVYNSLKTARCPDCSSRAVYSELLYDCDSGLVHGNYICTGCSITELNFPTVRGVLDIVRHYETPSEFSVKWEIVAGQPLGVVLDFRHREVNIGRSVEVWKFQLRQGTLLPGWDIDPINERAQERRNKIFFRQLDTAHSVV